MWHTNLKKIGLVLVAAVWQTWSPWTTCTQSCGAGGTRVRSWGFSPGRNGADNQPNEGSSFQNQACTNVSSCPNHASIGQWGEWSVCTQTCYSGTVPQTHRTKTCQEATFSSDDRLNDGIITCKDLKEIKTSRDCKVEVQRSVQTSKN